MIQRVLISLMVLLMAAQTIAQDYELKSTVDVFNDLNKLHRGLRVLYIAAHPDDENTRLIAWLENEKHIETAYLSLTRGQGGQNLIGDEKGDALGVIRTYELLEARKIDGGEQLFTRAVDFGYSKSAKESFEKWGKEEVLADVVYAIRKFRPHVIITRFPPDRNAGHGHHEASAILAAEAFDLAADPKAFVEQFDRVETWQANTLYFNTSSWWRKELEGKSDEELKAEQIHVVNIGVFDPLTGQAINEISSLARSKHRCQAFGTARDRGERKEFLQFVKGTHQEAWYDTMQGVWMRSPDHQKAILEVLNAFDFKNPKADIELINEGIMRKVGQRNMWADAKDIAWVNQMLDDIALNLNGVRVEAFAGQDPVVVGSDYLVTIEVYNGGASTIDIRFSHPNIDTSFSVEEGRQVSFTRLFRAPNEISTPYWLRNPHKDLYVLDKNEHLGLPFLEDERIKYVVKADRPLSGSTVLHRKWTDRSLGEIVQPMRFVPLISVTPSVKSMIVRSWQDIEYSTTAHAYEDCEMSWIPLDVNTSASIGFANLKLKKGQELMAYSSSTGYKGLAPKNIERAVKSGDVIYNQSIRLINYDHIPEIQIIEPALIEVTFVEMGKAKGKILYIEGSGDEVDESLELIGYEIDRTPLAQLGNKELDSYKAIIVGIRAYNTNDELPAYYDKLMRYVSNGGNLITQYNTSYSLKLEQIGPYPFKISRQRVTEEDATPDFLVADHAVFSKPNKISMNDFDGWVQERGLYFAEEWSDEFTPLIRWKDADETEFSDGALILAQYGKGSFFYTGISFFRELPAGIPGAYRLMVNMIEYKP
jgi:LmbE family N-acetylglucosaminyl deacetylase